MLRVSRLTSGVADIELSPRQNLIVARCNDNVILSGEGIVLSYRLSTAMKLDKNDIITIY